MAKKRRRSRKNKNNSKSTGVKVYDTVSKLAPWYTFFSQLTSKDYEALQQQAPEYRNADLQTKAKVFVNMVGGRLAGFTPFKGDHVFGTDDIKFTINPGGVVNKFSGVSLAGLLYSRLPMKFLPEKARVGSLAKKTLTASILGGLFDAPPAGQANTQVSTPRVNYGGSPVITQNRKVSTNIGAFSPSQDSTAGSFSI